MGRVGEAAGVGHEVVGGVKVMAMVEIAGPVHKSRP
jgi:hypothetical protein